MNELERYLDGQSIKPNLTQEELLELKKLLEKDEAKELLGTRTPECYLWEIERKLKNA